MRRFAPASVLLVTQACAAGPAPRAKVPLRIDPPSERELAACDLAEPPAHQGTYTDRFGNTYAVVAHADLDQTLVETIDSGRGGPLAPGPIGDPGLAPTPAAPPGAPIASPESTGMIETPAADASAPAELEPGNHRMHLHWPLPATGVTSLFGARADPLTGRNRFHYGVDLQGEYGELVRATASGRVIFAGWNGGHGRQVIIEHLGGWRTSYSHLAQHTVVRGQRVVAGQAVGQVGNSGRSTGPHLHLEITRWGSYFDPLDVLGTAVAID